MKLPPDLQNERDFMALYRMALLGTRVEEHDLIETIVALAFMKGQSNGLRDAHRVVRGELRQ